MFPYRDRDLCLLWMFMPYLSVPVHGIVGGYQATFGENKWQALLFLKSEYVCGGSLIHVRHVLTAAHCAFDKRRMIPRHPWELTVRMGEHDLTDDNEVAPHQDCPVEQVIVHEGYKGTGRHHDIALLKLVDGVVLDWHIQIIPLPEKDSGSFEGDWAKVSGWGFLGHGKPSPTTLHEVYVEVFKQDDCRKLWALDDEKPVAVSQDHLCAGVTPRGKDFCWIDSGGPLSVKHYRQDQSNATDQLIGVVSRGQCGEPNKPPGLYMRVTAYLDWIHGNLK